ncbi:hypothetical protein [Novosphingobium resinovorum]|uniref:hypothetical protein n=1 Tax=Novosphingobium resinovorum TaxID=158500 RepID=UPI0012E9F90A|nr:hypothetical protein [Novosphingobium resinovorum]
MIVLFRLGVGQPCDPRRIRQVALPDADKIARDLHLLPQALQNGGKNVTKLAAVLLRGVGPIGLVEAVLSQRD